MNNILKLDNCLDFSINQTTLSGTPQGMDALVLAEIARGSPNGVLHIALDEGAVIRIPSWDCLPYDRISPNPETSSMRLVGLSTLVAKQSNISHLVVITTLNASLQRIPARDIVGSATYTASVGQNIELDSLLSFLARNGYQRSGTVREAGEFAVRGGIVDIFPPGAELPVRLDLFGDELEGVRSFDPLSQRAVARVDALKLEPVSEIFLDDESIVQFRGGYGSRFGAVAGQSDPLYQAITSGRRYMGMEHWLPLFHRSWSLFSTTFLKQRLRWIT